MRSWGSGHGAAPRPALPAPHPSWDLAVVVCTPGPVPCPFLVCCLSPCLFWSRMTMTGFPGKGCGGPTLRSLCRETRCCQEPLQPTGTEPPGKGQLCSGVGCVYEVTVSLSTYQAPRKQAVALPDALAPTGPPHPNTPAQLTPLPRLCSVSTVCHRPSGEGAVRPPCLHDKGKCGCRWGMSATSFPLGSDSKVKALFICK